MHPRKLTPEIVADLYEAAIDEHYWPQFSAVVGKATGIPAVSVWLTQNNRVIDASMAEAYRPFLQPYLEHFGKLDPWAGSLARKPLDTVMLAYEHIRENELVKTEFCNDFARLGGMFRPIGVRMQLAPGVFATMGSEMPFAKSLFEPADKRRVEQVLPYVKRALQLRQRCQQIERQTGPHAAALDAMTFGIVICNAAGHVVWANAFAEALGRARAGIALAPRGREVGAFLPEQSTELAALIHSAATGGAGGAITLKGKDRGGKLLVLVTPLPRSLFQSYGPSHVLLTLRQAPDDPPFSAQTLAALFRLSPAQGSLAMALYEGKTFEEIAVERGVKVSTLRTHLTNVLVRTGAKNIRELVRLLASLPPLR
jgi:DNA-binding CsgD family transcriptional regulator/PAS domain-containing protein